MSQRQLQKEATRDRIVDAAARRLRCHGAEGVGVADVMAEAGLTHGGFYAHFASKEDLMAAAVARATEHRRGWLAVDDTAPETARIDEIARRYLSAEHRDHPANGCPYPALLGGAGELPVQVRNALDQECRETLARLTDKLEDAPDMTAAGKARALAALMIGAMQLARLAPQRESDKILAAARAFAARAATETPEREDPAQ